MPFFEIHFVKFRAVDMVAEQQVDRRGSGPEIAVDEAERNKLDQSRPESDQLDAPTADRGIKGIFPCRTSSSRALLLPQLIAQKTRMNHGILAK